MTGRESAFNNPNLIEFLSEDFIPVAANCSILQQKQDQEGRFFREIAEQGHYAGRTQPTNTRQGLYVATSDGKLLASINATNPQQVMGVASQGLRHWKAAYANGDSKTVEELVNPDYHYQAKFPEGGLALRETMRDLPRGRLKTLDADKHNFDHVWLKREEVQSLVPTDPRIGQKRDVAPEILRRLTRFHFIDQVRGESSDWKPEDVKVAKIELTVLKVDEAKVEVGINGKAKITKAATGDYNPYTDTRITKERGLDLKIYGVIIFDRKQNSLTCFDMVAIGERWGSDVYNFRQNDMEPAPIGFAFELVAPKTENLIPPQALNWGSYFE